VLPPDINSSFKNFTVLKGEEKSDKDRIRFGLLTIKNVGENIVEAIVEERKNGEYASLTDFLERVSSKDLNKRSIEALAKTGALDEFIDRSEILHNLDKILEHMRQTHNTKLQNQSSLFSTMQDTTSIPQLQLTKTAPASLEEKLAWEKELLGLYVSGHPLDKFQTQISKNKKNITIELVKSSKPQTMFFLNVMITQIRRILTKKGDPMAFVKLTDLTDEIEAVVFPKTWEQSGESIIESACVAIKGRFSERNGSPSIIAEEIRKI